MKTTSFYLPVWFPYLHESQPLDMKEWGAEYDLIVESLNREIGLNWSIVSYEDECFSLPELGTQIRQSCVEVTFQYYGSYLLSFANVHLYVCGDPVNALDNMLYSQPSFFLEKL